MKLVGKAAILTAVFATSTTVMLSALAVDFTTVPDIAYFAGTAATMDGWIGRSMTITSVSRHPIGTVQSVDLAFGADNGSVNRLYVAYGDSDGGTSIKDWQDFAYLGEVTGETNSWHAAVPTSRFCRFFMVDSSMGTPLKWVTSNGSAYLDTGLTLKGGDAISLRFRPEKVQQMLVLGTRENVNSNDVAITFGNDRKIVLDYCNGTNGSYATYRLYSSAVPTNDWYDVVLSASERSVHDLSGASKGANTVLCDAEFETEYNCWLFSTSGHPASGSKNLTGSIASFEIVRGGDCIASYQPFRRGGKCGFLDLTTGNFIAAASGAFSGVEDDVAFSPFATATDALAKGPGTEIMQPREVSVVSVIRSGGETQVQLAFGSDNGCANRLYVAYGESKAGNRLEDWENVQYLGVVNGATDSLQVALPVSAQFCRFFLFLPFEGDDVPVPLQYVTGNGSGYFDTGFKLQGGDAITAGICPKGGRNMQVLGTRKTVDTNDVEVIFASDRLTLDYCSGSAGSYDTFRLVTSEKSVSLNTWYDIVLSASERSVHDASGALIKENTVLCDHVFETEENCWLFAVSGSTSNVNKFDGNVAEFTLKRGDRFLASYSPCRIGKRYGFYDLANGVFVTPATGTFGGVEDTSGSSPLAFVTESIRLIKRGFIISFK